MPPRRSSEDPYHHGDLRAALVRTALELLERGEDPSLRTVARNAGVSHAAPYHHFADRRALMAAVAEEGLALFRDALRGAAARENGGAALRLLAIGAAYVRFGAEHPARFRLMFSPELADRSELPELQAAHDAAYAVLLEGMREVMGPDAPQAELERQALVAWSTVHGLSMLILDNQLAAEPEDPEAVERLAREVLGQMRPGVAVDPPPEG